VRTIRKGDTGDAVLQWQGILGIGETGVFDVETEEWTSAWQRQRGLEPDGIVGPKTWGAAGFVERVASDIDDDFFPKLRLVAMALGARARDMMAVMYSESACKADAWNDNPKSLPPEKRWNASGLIQFMPPTLVGLGWTQGHAVFRTLTATQQLSWVERYYRPYRGHLGTVGGLYVATFLPALVKHAGDPSFVLTAKAGVLPWAYGPNAAFDANHDLQITVGELEAAVARNCHGARWDDLIARLTREDAVVTQPSIANPASEPTIHPAAPDQPIIHADPLAYFDPKKWAEPGHEDD
jgi:Putative peptidoglycan binding domain